MKLEIAMAGNRTEFVVPADLGTVGIGRGDDNHIILHSEVGASRHHARLEFTPQGWKVVDLGSANGTRLNGTKVSEAPLNDGDTIQVGATLIQVSELVAKPQRSFVAPLKRGGPAACPAKPTEKFAFTGMRISRTTGKELTRIRTSESDGA